MWTYGNSSLRGGVAPLSPHTGVSLGDDAADGGWSHPLYTVTPGIPGDSGSGFLSAGGKAVGTLSTLGLAPLPASNNIGDLAKELAFAQANSGISGLTLVQRHRAVRPHPLRQGPDRVPQNHDAPPSSRGWGVVLSGAAGWRRLR